MIAWKLEPEIYNFRSLEAITTIAATLQVTDYPVHIKLDTGMHRLGFGAADIDALAARLKVSKEIKVASIFTHLVASDDPAEDTFTADQAQLFDTMSSKILNVLPYKPLMHISNSSGISRHGKLQYSMVRLGVGLYGIDSSERLRNKLRQISTLRTSIAQVRDIPAGDSIGYGHHNSTDRNMQIAVICIGYADGYPRSLGNGKAHVLINGRHAPTVGSICMDMCMVDITNIQGVREGDDALVFGPELPVSNLATWAGTISYEIMAGISQRVKRVYINGE
jgi:alanine racemase